jgi:hypothetical protein
MECKNTIIACSDESRYMFLIATSYKLEACSLLPVVLQALLQVRMVFLHEGPACKRPAHNQGKQAKKTDETAYLNKSDLHRKKAMAKFLMPKMVLYQCTSIDMIQSKAERLKVTARTKM